MKRSLWILMTVAMVLFGACSDDDPAVEAGDDGETTTTAAAEPEVHEVSFSAKEYSYSKIEGVKSGVVAFEMKNDGKELHIAALAKIKDGKTFADATKDLQIPPGSPAPADPAAAEVSGIASTSPGLAGK